MEVIEINTLRRNMLFKCVQWKWGCSCKQIDCTCWTLKIAYWYTKELNHGSSSIVLQRVIELEPSKDITKQNLKKYINRFLWRQARRSF